MGGFISGPATIAGSAIEAAGLRRQADQQLALARLQAADIQREAIDQQIDLERQQDNVAAAQRAAFGARGVKVNVGTPLAVLAETERLGAQAVARLQRRAQAEIQRVLLGAQAQADLLRTKARVTLLTGIGSGVGQILDASGKALAFGL